MRIIRLIALLSSVSCGCAALFSTTKHGSAVQVDATGGTAHWSTAASCNQIVLVEPTKSGDTLSFWLSAASESSSDFIDLGWCDAAIDYTGTTWLGPAPAWIGYQQEGKAWVYRGKGQFKASAPYPGHAADGVPYGKPLPRAKT